jgi:flagellar hook-associated protein 1 FlgK
MSIYSALSVGVTALNASQKALEVVGNNIANASTPNYSRQEVVLSPGAAIGSTFKIGTGVRVTQILRRFDAAVESRLRHAISDNASASIQSQTLDRVEGLYAETSDVDLSTSLSEFFNSFNDLANNPQDDGVRTVVIEQTKALVNQITRMRESMDGLRLELNSSVQVTVDEINRLSGEVASLNEQVVLAEQGRLNSAPSLRDERDAKLRELAEVLDIRTVEQESGAVNVIVGNQVLVDGRYCRQLECSSIEDRNIGISEIRFADNDELLSLTGGALQGYVVSRDDWIGQQIDALDRLTSAMIFEVNCLHAEGTGTTLPSSVRSDRYVLDSAAVLNTDEAGLPNTPVNGSFLLHVTNSTSGLTETLTVDVDLDGVGGDDSLQTIVAQINALATTEVPPLNVQASIDTTGHLVIQGTSPEIRVSFSDDSSKLLACVGVNCLFTGYDSVTIGISSAVEDDPRLLAAGLSAASGDNANALRLAELADLEIDDLGGSTIQAYHTQSSTRLAVNTAAAESASTSAETFLSTMSDERESISGVNLDEEAINLVKYQKMYTASAKFMSLMSDLMDKLMEI